jgi:hypothetical protein
MALITRAGFEKLNQVPAEASRNSARASLATF